MKNVNFPSLNEHDVFALLENRKVDKNAFESHLFWEPLEILTCHSSGQIESFFLAIQKLQKSGAFLVGYFSYELGYCFEQKLNLLLEPASTLSVVVAFKNHLPLNQIQVEHFLRTVAENRSKQLPCLAYNFRFNTNKEAYLAAVGKVKNYIREGDIYQANYTIGLEFNYQGRPWQLYNSLRERQKVEYSAFLNLKEQTILSLSPELFFRKQGDYLQTKPMKGTAPRGKSSEEDLSLSNFMKNDPKTLAENVMIVDLLRNDIGRIAEPGTVNVSKLFEVETYETVLQMTSTIEGKLLADLSLMDLFKNIYPCGSVTGAPKIRAMEIIHELESGPRGIYTGALGYCMPNNDICMNVPIRTVILNNQGLGRLGVGSGIVFDSDAESEYQEVVLKARFLTGINSQFELIETLLYSPANGYLFLNEHLARLKKTSDIFSFKCPIENIHQAFIELSDAMLMEVDYKVRLLLRQDGQFSLSFEPLNADLPAKKTIIVSPNKICSSNILFQYKTTHSSTRGFYEREYQQAKNKYDCYDVVFTNERGEITEGTRSNIFFEKNGVLYTPPVNCGLLKGIQRERLLKDKNSAAVEKVIVIEDLYAADKIYLTNSVRGVVEVKLAAAPAAAKQWNVAIT